jgi:hypothetical protein
MKIKYINHAKINTFISYKYNYTIKQSAYIQSITYR